MIGFYSKALKCCGICEIHGVQSNPSFDPKSLIEWICYKFNYNKLANASKELRKEAGRGLYIMTFVEMKETDLDEFEERDCTYRTTKTKIANDIKALTKYVEDNKLGEIIRIPNDIRNPNYRNRRKIYLIMFVPNQESMLKFSKKMKWAHSHVGGYELNYWINGS